MKKIGLLIKNQEATYVQAAQKKSIFIAPTYLKFILDVFTGI